MAVRLHAWLEDAFESQLLLGNRWLQDRHEKKKSSVRPKLAGGTGRRWSAYHDNGSSLDTINYTGPDRNCALQVLKLSPLTLSDGQYHIISNFTPDCARDFFQRHPAVSHLAIGTAIVPRKYTVRLTSYGPPRERLRLILNQIDWLGDSCERLQSPNTESLKSLHACEQIGALLEQLRHTRALEDSRCLISRADKADVEAVDDATADDMNMDDNMQDNNNLQSQMPDTQQPFGTQVPQPSRSRTREDGPQFLGVNRLEPVLAGDTQRGEIRPGAANTNYEKATHLLNVLGYAQKPTASKNAPNAELGVVQSAFRKQQSTATPATDETPGLPLDPSHGQPTPSAPRAENVDAASTVPNHGRKKTKKVRHVSPEPTKAAEDDQVQEQDIQQSSIEDGIDKLPECSWMKGFVFNSETLKVPKLQADCLGKETSWLKPQPGVPAFQNGNMPALTLNHIHRMADEKADADIDVDEDSEVDPSPESLDPSPESLVQKTQDSEPATTQDDDDDTASQVSWDESPEPPERPTRPQQELPPDSSMEKPASHSEHSSHPPVVNISDGDEPVGPPSSPPAPAPAPVAPADSDEEMDMEESVPQALGEDLVQRTQPSPASDKLPVVHVKETPYGKGKSASVPRNVQTSSGEPKHTSSTSIVHSTYDTPSASALADLAIVDIRHGDIGAESKKGEVHHENVSNANANNTGDIEMPDNILEAENLDKQTARDIAAKQQLPNDLAGQVMPSSTSHATPNSAQIPSKSGGLEASMKASHLASQSTKRKLDGSPTKSDRRKSKRRELKLVSFGGDAPSNVDPISSLRKDREESLRRYREQRNSSTASFENGPEPTSELIPEQGPDTMEIDDVDAIVKTEPSPSMSPRHQGLYDEPSPRRVQSTAKPAPQPLKTHTPSKVSSLDARTRGPVPIPAQFSSASSRKLDQDSNMTVFQSFRAAYPEYTGNEKHFENQCKQMYQLEQEDKMVPKWQWDDFIIRNRTDFSQYAMDCVSEGQDPGPYYRFYKDNIRDTLYKRGIIENVKTLQRALEELAGTSADTNKHRQTRQPAQKPNLARKSLPGAFDHPRKPAREPAREPANTTRTRPRHSLPTNLQLRRQSPHKPTPSSSRPQPRHSNQSKRVSSASQRRTQLSPVDTADTPDMTNAAQEANSDETFNAEGSTGDKYRDFYFGFQRISSWTGSTNVSPTPKK